MSWGKTVEMDGQVKGLENSNSVIGKNSKSYEYQQRGFRGRATRREQRRSEDGIYETWEGESRKKAMGRRSGGKGEGDRKAKKKGKVDGIVCQWKKK